jgi:hypothetical protein
MKNKLIIIHGAKPLSSNNKYIQKLISFIYKFFFNYIPKINIENPWTCAFPKSKFDIIELKWSGRIIPYDMPKTSKKLTKILNSHPLDNYFFLTESIGTQIALLGIEKSKAKNIKKIISICPVNKPKEIKDFSMIFIKSKSDTFARFSNKFLWPFSFFKTMRGNFEEIIIQDIRHDQFVPNYQIGKKQTLLEFVEKRMESF